MIGRGALHRRTRLRLQRARDLSAEEFPGNAVDQRRRVSGEAGFGAHVDEDEIRAYRGSNGRTAGDGRGGVTKRLDKEIIRELRREILGGDLHLGCDEASIGDLSRRRVEGAEEVEDGGREQRPLPHDIRRALHVIAPALGAPAVGAPQLRHAQQRLFQLAGNRCVGRGRARLGVEQQRPHDRAEITPAPRPIVRKHLRHALHVGGRGVAGHEPLDQLLRNERPDIRVIENVVERVVEVAGRIGRRARRNPGERCTGVAEDFLCTRIMLLGVSLHGQHLVLE